MTNIIKLILAVLLFLCLAEMPYGYYQLVRFLSVTGFAYFAYQAKNKENVLELVLYVCLAVLFQPFIKISLGRELWNFVDVLVALMLIGSIVLKSKLKKDN